MKAMIEKFMKDEAGLETIEYAILGAICVAVAVVGYNALATAISDKFEAIGGNITDGTAG